MGSTKSFVFHIPIETNDEDVRNDFHEYNFAPKYIESDIIWVFSQTGFVKLVLISTELYCMKFEKLKK